jgi:predicted nucleic acid-binding protein
VTLLLDASAVVDLLIRSDRGDQVRAALAGRDATALSTVAHLDAEVFSALARSYRSGQLDADEIGRLLEHLAALPARRLPITGALLTAAWSLRSNIAARDALHVAAAEALGARLVTTDGRLARALPDLVIPLK